MGVCQLHRAASGDRRHRARAPPRQGPIPPARDHHRRALIQPRVPSLDRHPHEARVAGAARRPAAAPRDRRTRDRARRRTRNCHGAAAARPRPACRQSRYPGDQLPRPTGYAGRCHPPRRSRIGARHSGVAASAQAGDGRGRAKMIITVTLNAALDKTLEVPNFTPGRRHRTVDQITMPGGKGVNIARALKRLGQPVIATGLAGGATGGRIIEALNDEAVVNGFVRIREESRTNTAVLDPTTGLHTEINERGPTVTAMELELFRDKLKYLAKGASMCVFAGSLPRGMEPDAYAALVRDIRMLGVLTIVDTDGDPLRLAVRAEPQVVSPNELEAEELVGHEFNDIDDRAQAVAEMVRIGAGEAIMTVPDGCYAQVNEDGAPALYRVRIDEQEARSTVGSGDAFLAGWVAARYQGRSPVDCLSYGVACGAESTPPFGAGPRDPGKVEKLLSEVEYERLELRAEIS